MSARPVRLLWWKRNQGVNEMSEIGKWKCELEAQALELQHQLVELDLCLMRTRRRLLAIDRLLAEPMPRSVREWDAKLRPGDTVVWGTRPAGAATGVVQWMYAGGESVMVWVSAADKKEAWPVAECTIEERPGY